MFETIDETTCKLLKYTGDSLTPIIPETDQEGRKVVAIGASAFAKTAITEVTIPSAAEQLGVLSELFVGYGTETDGVFYNCASLKTIHFDGQLKVVGDFSFKGCAALETNVWEFCTKLENVGKGAFEALGCLSEELVMPETLKTIDKYAFQSCTGVKKLSFASDGITRLFGSSFAKMPNLEEVIIPACITSLEDCFKEDYALKSFTYTRSVSADGSITANNPFGTSSASSYSDLVIYVPEDSVNEYSEALGSFAEKINKEA